mmetsp:Transcript_116245/g.340040  ORF Transcript_116245/g.340040 Transcript_116245/m.340040 type:complete len:531 (-) Transcript_116245:362-1954(-)
MAAAAAAAAAAANTRRGAEAVLLPSRKPHAGLGASLRGAAAGEQPLQLIAPDRPLARGVRDADADPAAQGARHSQAVGAAHGAHAHALALGRAGVLPERQPGGGLAREAGLAGRGLGAAAPGLRVRQERLVGDLDLHPSHGALCGRVRRLRIGRVRGRRSSRRCAVCCGGRTARCFRFGLGLCRALLLRPPLLRLLLLGPGEQVGPPGLLHVLPEVRKLLQGLRDGRLRLLRVEVDALLDGLHDLVDLHPQGPQLRPRLLHEGPHRGVEPLVVQLAGARSAALGGGGRAHDVADLGDAPLELAQAPHGVVEVQLRRGLAEPQVLEGLVPDGPVHLEGVHEEAHEGVGLVRDALRAHQKRQGVQREAELAALLAPVVEVVAHLHHEREDAAQRGRPHEAGDAAPQHAHVLGDAAEVLPKLPAHLAALGAQLEAGYLHQGDEELLRAAPGQHAGVVRLLERLEGLCLLFVGVEADDLSQVVYGHDLLIEVEDARLDVVKLHTTAIEKDLHRLTLLTVQTLGNALLLSGCSLR